METFTDTPEGRTVLLRAVLTPENYADILRSVRRRAKLSQHYTAVLYKEILNDGSVADSHGSQISMWETKSMRPYVGNFIRWANALGCDVMLVPRRELPEPEDGEDPSTWEVVDLTEEEVIERA